MLVQGAENLGSFNTRRFALTAISHLCTMTLEIVPVLLAGCQNIAKVQQHAIDAAGRFQSIEGDPPFMLREVLIGESKSTATLYHIRSQLWDPYSR